MITAYVLIQTEIGRQLHVAEEVEHIEGVEITAVVTGPYDVIVQVSAADVHALGRLIISSFHAVDGVVRTLTCPVVRL
jgi:DNA-binding Lrp family transcriptional regulator